MSTRSDGLPYADPATAGNTTTYSVDDVTKVLHRVMDQVQRDFVSAHAEIAKLQGLDRMNVSWPEWSSQANTLRWFKKIREEMPLSAKDDPGRPVPPHGSGP